VQVSCTFTEINEFNIGVILALFERSVGYYSSLVNINAYHQPGVEAGKKAAGDVIDSQGKIVEFLSKNNNSSHSAGGIAEGINSSGEEEKIFLICQHLSAQKDRGIKKMPSDSLDKVTFQKQ